jgi:hypothetical protein
LSANRIDETENTGKKSQSIRFAAEAIERPKILLKETF